uniref:Uncharacterized protein n=1 Tax=Bombyx mori nuclear polyhedrosis virus TaxID=271108 RepID=I6UHB3_NPVBM|nr:hypothetical protein Bmnpvcubicgp117 [Bombyx mori nucleopolyhedrovirus]BEV20984.1 hypothetical protein [Bombyx mori nucleopolyhedrovirus]
MLQSVRVGQFVVFAFKRSVFHSVQCVYVVVNHLVDRIFIYTSGAVTCVIVCVLSLTAR